MDDVRSTPQFRAWRLFLMAHRAVVERLEQQLLAERGLSLAYYDVLAQLAAAPDRRLRMNELASRLLLSRSGVTRLIDRMQRDGLVERARCPSDRRGSFAVLTERGLTTLRRALPVHVSGIRRLFADHLSEGEAETLARVLSRLVGRSEAERAARPLELGTA